MSTQLCDYCHQKPRFSNHLYCGKTCAGKVAQSPTPPRAQIQTGLCNSCHSKPKFQNFDYCGRTCAASHKIQKPAPIGNVSDNCDVCHIKPKWNDGTKVHPFCSKACANASSKTTGGGGHGPAAMTKTPGVCHAPGCQKTAFVNPNGSPSFYCSKSHKTLGETLCLMCFQAPKMTKSYFCSQACMDQARHKGPMMLEVPIGHVAFKDIEEQFKASWRHPTRCPEVRRIYKICPHASLLDSYDAYKANVEAHGQFTKSGRSPGNENRRWHGTRRECNVGNDGKTQLCSSRTCSLCCIIKNSFEVNFFGKNTGWGRFGRGIYTSSTSSKSNDYAKNKFTSKLKVIILSKVVVGKGYKVTHDQKKWTSPPSGYDSVLAETGGSLKYDELVVYDNDAIRPSFLVLYERK